VAANLPKNGLAPGHFAHKRLLSKLVHKMDKQKKRRQLIPGPAAQGGGEANGELSQFHRYESKQLAL